MQVRRQSESSPLTTAVIGAGSWGSALAVHMARRGHPTCLWARRDDAAAQMRDSRENSRYLPGIRFPDGLRVESDAKAAVEGAQVLIWVIPSQWLRATVREFNDAIAALGNPLHLVAVKGVELDTLASMSEVVDQELGHQKACMALGGPSFAREVGAGLPTAVVVAGEDPDRTLTMQRALSGAGLRAYRSEDVTGVELGGAFKNVIAVAAGIIDGAELGMNARAGLMTRGLAEISRLALSMGARPSTLSGLAGMGDLVLTCTGGLSRNRRVGLALGQGKALEDVLREMGMVAEGVRNAKSALALARRARVDMPITRVVHDILYEGLSVERAVEDLMHRALKPE